MADTTEDPHVVKAEDDAMVEADAGEDAEDAAEVDAESENEDEAEGSPEGDALTGFAAGQAAGNIHMAGEGAETMELAAASKEAQVQCQ